MKEKQELIKKQALIIEYVLRHIKEEEREDINDALFNLTEVTRELTIIEN